MLYKKAQAVAPVLLLLLVGSMVVMVPAAFAVDEPSYDPVVLVRPEPQQIVVSALEAPAIKRDNYSVTEPPKPEPVVAIASRPEAEPMPNPAPGTGLYSRDGTVVWPFNGAVRLSDRWGYRNPPVPGTKAFHDGTDFLPGEGNPVLAATGAIVTEVVISDSGLGVHVTTTHTEGNSTVKLVYCHMQMGSLMVSVGDGVYPGQQIGRVGQTGVATGPHLHFEVWVNGSSVDGYEWLNTRVG